MSEPFYFRITFHFKDDHVERHSSGPDDTKLEQIYFSENRFFLFFFSKPKKMLYDSLITKGLVRARLEIFSYLQSKCKIPTKHSISRV